MSNSSRIWLILALSSVALIAGAHWLFGREGVFWAFSFVGLVNGLLYAFSTRYLCYLFQSLPLEGRDPWGFLIQVSHLSRMAGIPAPKIHFTELPIPTAFAVGQNVHRSVIVVSRMLLDKLSPTELAALAAQQMASIKRHDAMAFALTCTVASLILQLGLWLDRLWTLGIYKNQKHRRLFFGWIMDALSSLFLFLAIGHRGYFDNDQMASRWLGAPGSLAQVLWKLNSYAETSDFKPLPATRPMFVVDPQANSPARGWFRGRHPSVRSRLKRLVGYYPV